MVHTGTPLDASLSKPGIRLSLEIGRDLESIHCQSDRVRVLEVCLDAESQVGGCQRREEEVCLQQVATASRSFERESNGQIWRYPPLQRSYQIAGCLLTSPTSSADLCDDRG